ncbi:OmpA family protein [Costertonia aggregata]|uniref:OmpA family protein n=1 Tax=Costertonia aggregata TaxID=343403 RepID=A0A7H9AR87_9FLAO|nr:OmpA family protein [Costertonia aggregata]QLG45929.1 OmpA family protein [Costertonia aggregata]
MNTRRPFAIFTILVLGLLACNESPKKNTIQNDQGKAVEEPDLREATEDLEEAMEDIDIDELMKGMGDLMSGGAKDSTSQGLFTEKGALNLELLRSDKGAYARQLFAKMVGVSEKEVQIALTAMPDNNIVSVKHAEDIEQSLSNPEVEAYIASGEASQNFIELLEESKTEAKVRTTNFKARAEKAKRAFYKLNPSWFALTKNMEDTYVDSRKEMVYLPMGTLSFADSVVFFKPGEPDGFFPERCLGTSQGDADLQTDCTILGSGGSIVLFFKDNAITDVNGPDIFVFEQGAAIEPTNLQLSKDGQSWIDIGKVEGGTGLKDITDYVKPGETFNYIKITDLKTSFGPPPGADIDAVAAIGGALRMSLDSAVLFDTGEHELKPEGAKAIRKLAQQIQDIPKGTITVEGHTDDVGSDQTNLVLSKKRAATVAAELRKSINNSSFKWKEVGLGETSPLAPNENDGNRRKNRRVEILVAPF